jgi:hypothetical protein
MAEIRPKFDIDTYKTRFLGGARLYLFFVVFSFPAALSTGDKGKSVGPNNTGSSIIDDVRNANSFKDINVISSAKKAGMSALSSFGLGKSDDMYSYLVKNTSLPGITFDEKIIEWSGLPFKMAGNLAFNDWTITLNIDESGDILRIFNKWCQKIQNPITGNRTSIVDYFSDQFLHLLDYSGNTITSFKLYGSWPKSIGDVALDYSSNEVATVDVTFSYQFYEILGKPDKFLNDTIKRGFNKLLGK